MSRTDNSDRFEFQLGAVVEDVQTGLTGVVVALSEHITGCERYGVMPDSGRGSQRPDEQFYYAQELEQLKTPAEGPFAEEAEAVTRRAPGRRSGHGDGTSCDRRPRVGSRDEDGSGLTSPGRTTRVLFFR